MDDCTVVSFRQNLGEEFNRLRLHGHHPGEIIVQRGGVRACGCRKCFVFFDYGGEIAPCKYTGLTDEQAAKRKAEEVERG